MFNQLTKAEKEAFIQSLTEADLNWLGLLIELYGGRVGVAMERFYASRRLHPSGLSSVSDERIYPTKI
jgi:hypothetical protein